MSNFCSLFPFDLTGILCLNQSQKLIYQQAWATFDRIQGYNSNVSTLRGLGDTSLTYYTYVSYSERESFRIGQVLHARVYPNNNWNTIEEN